MAELIVTTEIPIEDTYMYYAKKSENGTLEIWRAKRGRKKKEDK